MRIVLQCNSVKIWFFVFFFPSILCGSQSKKVYEWGLESIVLQQPKGPGIVDCDFFYGVYDNYFVLQKVKGYGMSADTYVKRKSTYKRKTTLDLSRLNIKSIENSCPGSCLKRYYMHDVEKIILDSNRLPRLFIKELVHISDRGIKMISYKGNLFIINDAFKKDIAYLGDVHCPSIKIMVDNKNPNVIRALQEARMPTWSNLWKHTKWDLLKISFLTGFILASYNIGVKKYSGVSYASGFLLAILDAYYISPLVSTTYKWASTPRSFIVPEDMPD